MGECLGGLWKQSLCNLSQQCWHIGWLEGLVMDGLEEKCWDGGVDLG